MKRLFALLLVLALTPLGALAELTHNVDGRFIVFPELDEWYGRFDRVANWTIVTPENLEEHWDLVAARGDTAEEIRARYADEHFLFEAYSTDLPEDACFRAEVYENDFTREVWHLRHWSTAQRKQINEYLMSGNVLPDRDVYSVVNAGSGEMANVWGYFTNYPPETHESGKIRFDFRNGKMYVFSYCVSGRLAGAKRWYSSKDDQSYSRTPMSSLETRFKSTCLPRMPLYELTSAMPELVAPGTVTITGTVEAGSTFEAALDGEPLASTVDKKGNFTVDVPLTECGERELVFTVANKKYTTRTMTYAITVSDTCTPLTMTQEPALFSDVGSVELAGLTASGAQVAVTLDGGEAAVVTAGEDGAFSCTVAVEAPGVYNAVLSAWTEGREATSREFAFTADYASANEGIKAFNEQVTDVKFSAIAENVEDYIGTKVKISILTKEITLNEQGLGILAVYNASKEKDQTPLYINVPGYAQCQIGERMILTVYATVDGKRVMFDADSGEETERVELTVEYGTYLVSK